METSSQTGSVLPLAACAHLSRRGPVSGSVEEVLQLASQGKYSNLLEHSLPDDFRCSSKHVTATKVSPPLMSTCQPSAYTNDHHQTSAGRTSSHVEMSALELVEPTAAYALHGCPVSSDDDGVSQPQRPGKVAQAPRSLLGYYQNVGGINTSIVDYQLACSDACYDWYAFTETWLNSSTTSRQIFDDSFTVYRQDRSPLNSHKRTGGGVLLAVRSSLKSHQLYPPSTSEIEQVWVQLSFEGMCIFVCVVYFPPDRINDDELIDKHLCAIDWVVSRMDARDNILILGDFNLREISWRVDSNGFSYPDCRYLNFGRTTTCLLDGYSTANLQQINVVPNSNNRMLDLAFVSEDLRPNCSVTQAPHPLVKDCMHHPALLLSLNNCTNCQFQDTTEEVLLDFNKADFDGMNLFLSSIDWNTTFRDCDTDLAASTLSNIVFYAIDQYVPTKTNPEKAFPIWSNTRLKRLKTAKRRALRKFIRHRTARNRARYTKANKRYKILNKRLFNSYQERLQRSLKLNPKSFWKYVDGQRKEVGLPSTMRNGDTEASALDDIADLFRKQFSGVFCNDPTSPQDIVDAVSNVPVLPPLGELPPISSDTVLSASRRLKNTTGVGPDGIPSIVLNKCIHSLSAPLATVFNLSLESGVFPTIWKESYVFPVHKKGCKQTVSNYRGIAALCATSKLFELIVLDFLSHGCSHYISEDQHGFMPKRSTTTNLTTFTSFLARSIERGCQIDAIYMDLSAAFDKMNHEIALAKYDKLGADARLLKWLRSYLMGRNMRVRLGNQFSTSFPVTSGVPQGSHLGPFLFLLFMNDVNSVLRCHKKSYADDFKIYAIIEKLDDAEFLQHQFETFADWCRRNRMVLNTSKCSVISFTRKRSPLIHNYSLSGVSLARESLVKDLGVLLDSKLTFNAHLTYIISKASSQLGFIFRFAKHFKDVYCLKALYCSLVRPILEYSSVVWSPYYQNGIQRVEKIQRKFIRYALRHLPWTDRLDLPSYESRCKLIHLDLLSVRRDVAKACFVSDLLTSLIDCPSLLTQLNINIRRRQLRTHAFLFIDTSRTNYGLNEPVRSMCRVFNHCQHVFDFSFSRASNRQNFLRFMSQ